MFNNNYLSGGIFTLQSHGRDLSPSRQGEEEYRTAQMLFGCCLEVSNNQRAPTNETLIWSGVTVLPAACLIPFVSA